MRALYVVHIFAASLALVSGYVALYSAKGALLHRKAGMLFVYTMLTMAVAGLTIAVVMDKGPAVNVPAAMLVSYLVITSLTTVRPMAAGGRWLAPAAMLVALAVVVTDSVFGFQAIANGGNRQGIPAFPFLLFAVIALLGFIGDLRVLRSGALQGAPRLARHLWRMTFALFIAALSFFIGQAKVIPKPIRIPGLLALPVLAVLVTLLYWLWRVRVRRSVRGLVQATAPAAL